MIDTAKSAEWELGIIKSASERGDYCHVSAGVHPPSEREPLDVFLHITNMAKPAAGGFDIGCWVKYRRRQSKRHPGRWEAFAAELIAAPSFEELVERQCQLYAGRCSDPASYRLDGLTRKEAKLLVDRGPRPMIQHYTYMSENGFRSILNQAGLPMDKANGRAEQVAAVMAVTWSRYGGTGATHER